MGRAIARPPGWLALPGAVCLWLLVLDGGALVAQTGRVFGDPNSIAPVLGDDRPVAVAPAAPARPRADNNAPVTFTADDVEYDRERGIVTARGRV